MMAVETESNRRLRDSARTVRAGAAADPLGPIALIGAVALVALAISLGGSPLAFFHFPSFLMVVGGTFAVTCVSFSAGEVIRAHPTMVGALTTATPEPMDAARGMMTLADMVRRHGPLALQDQLPQFKSDPFLHRAMSLVVDAAPQDEIEAVMAADADASAQRMQRSASILRRAAEVAPAMGLIGTLIGLVQMLGSLDEPSKIGPAMALALLTTLYGALLANIVFGPLAAKIERNASAEAVLRQIYLIGAVSMARQENPRRLEILLNSVLPPWQQIRFFG
jgi:chemotaxis protein MotA